jgi:hypothetical protein
VKKFLLKEETVSKTTEIRLIKTQIKRKSRKEKASEEKWGTT